MEKNRTYNINNNVKNYSFKTSTTNSRKYYNYKNYSIMNAISKSSEAVSHLERYDFSSVKSLRDME